MTKRGPVYQLRRLLGLHLLDETGSTLARGASGALVANVAGKIISFAAQAVLARLLGVAGYGHYIYAFTWHNLLVVPGKMGLAGASVRFIASYRGLERWSLIRGYLKRSRQLATLAAVFTAACAGLVVWLIQDHLEAGLPVVFWIAFAILPIHVLLWISTASLQAFKRVVWAQTIQQLLRPLLFIAVVLILFHGSKLEASASFVMAINGGALAVALLASEWHLRRSLPSAVPMATDEFETRQWVGVSFSFLLLAGIQVVLSQAGVLMLGALAGTAKAGIYAAAVRVSILVSFGLVAVIKIASPLIAELYAQKRLRELQRMATLAVWGIMAFTFPAGMGIILLGRWILGLFGPAFVEGYPALLILTVMQLVNAIAGPVGLFLAMTGCERVYVRFLIGAATVHILLNGLLIPMYGILGAAMATATSNILLNIVMAAYVLKHLRINVTALPFRRYGE